MVRILHISDPHGHSKTMANLAKLARSVVVDVIAYTGDSCSSSLLRLPTDWNAWPQPVKLAVPGEHCGPNAYADLTQWTTETPWALCFGGLLFVGINSANVFRRRGMLFPTIDPTMVYSGVVILSHHRPMGTSAEHITSALQSMLKPTPWLLLHGHEHGGAEMEEPDWEPDWTFGAKACARSKVISCARRNRGGGAIVSWNGSLFSWRAVSPVSEPSASRVRPQPPEPNREH